MLIAYNVMPMHEGITKYRPAKHMRQAVSLTSEAATGFSRSLEFASHCMKVPRIPLGHVVPTIVFVVLSERVRVTSCVRSVIYL